VSAPLFFAWDGETMTPLPRFAKMADREFVVGENYRLEIVKERSATSHNHFFACIEEAWRNLPEIYADRWPSAEHLRKWALVRAGFREETTFLASSHAEAVRVGALMRSIDEYAVVTVDGRMVIRAVAKSQSMAAMPGKNEFQDSKDKVLDVIARLVGVDPKELSKNAGRAA
jgi:hypothetical protein